MISTINQKKAVFIDMDGALLEIVPNNIKPAWMIFTLRAVAGLRMLQSAGYKLFVVSNQSGVARGLFQEADLVVVHQHLNEMLAKEGITLDGFYYCPHHPDGTVKEYAVTCSCRKPEPGLVYQAAMEHDIDLAASWFVGDVLDDIECGYRANCRTVMIDNGSETEWRRGPKREPHFIARDLFRTAQLIFENPDSLEPDEVFHHPIRYPMDVNIMSK